MTTFGFIGTGHLGGMLVRKFIETGAVPADKITVSNRTREKAKRLAADLGVGCKDNREVVLRSDVVFLCVRPLDVRGVLMELQDLLTPEKLLVSVAGDVSLEKLRSQCSARVARAFPSMASESLMGVTLLVLGESVTDQDRATILSLFGAIGHPVEVKEDHFEVLADLTSCGPGYIAAIMQEFALAASWRGIPRSLTEELAKGDTGRNRPASGERELRRAHRLCGYQRRDHRGRRQDHPRGCTADVWQALSSHEGEA